MLAYLVEAFGLEEGEGEGETVGGDVGEAESVLGCPVVRLGLGHYGYQGVVYTVTLDTSLAEVFQLFLTHKIYMLPIVEAGSNRLLNVVSRTDVLTLGSSHGVFDLSITLAEVLEERKVSPNAVIYVFSPLDTLRSVILQFARSGVRSLVAVDAHRRVCGFCSMIDLFHFLTNFQ